MQAIINECPFNATEALSERAQKGMHPIEEAIVERLQKVRDAGLFALATELDDAFLAAVTAVQNETIRGIVCSQCSYDSACHPEKAVVC